MSIPFDRLCLATVYPMKLDLIQRKPAIASRTVPAPAMVRSHLKEDFTRPLPKRHRQNYKMADNSHSESKDQTSGAESLHPLKTVKGRRSASYVTLPKRSRNATEDQIKAMSTASQNREVSGQKSNFFGFSDEGRVSC
jgi:hypothetical protein